MNPDNQQNSQDNFQQSPQNQRVVDSIRPPYPQSGNGNIPTQQVSPQNSQINNFQQSPQNVNQQNPSNLTGVNQTNNSAPAIEKSTKSKKPKFLIVIVAGVVLLGVMTAIAILAAPKKKSNNQNENTNQSQQAENDSLTPAQAIDVEQTNNSINQDISGLNVEDDFPPTQLDDKTINL